MDALLALLTEMYSDEPEFLLVLDRRPFAEQQRSLEALINQEVTACTDLRASIAATEQAILQSEIAALRWLRQYRKRLEALDTRRNEQRQSMIAQLQRIRDAFTGSKDNQ